MPLEKSRALNHKGLIGAMGWERLEQGYVWVRLARVINSLGGGGAGGWDDKMLERC